MKTNCCQVYDQRVTTQNLTVILEIKSKDLDLSNTVMLLKNN